MLLRLVLFLIRLRLQWIEQILLSVAVLEWRRWRGPVFFVNSLGMMCRCPLAGSASEYVDLGTEFIRRKMEGLEMSRILVC